MRSKKTWRIIARLTEVALLVLAVLLLAVNSPSVQTRITHYAIDRFADKVDGKIELGAIHLAPFRTLVIRDLTITDAHPQAGVDTVLHIDRASATFSLKSLLSKTGGVCLDRVRADGIDLYLVIDEEPGMPTNFQKVFNIRTEGDTLKVLPDLFSIKRADVADFHFKMINLIPKVQQVWKGVGINWADTDLTASAHGRNINFVDSRCSMEISHAEVSEKSGYSGEFSGNCITGRIADGTGLTEITDLEIKDKWSKVSIARYTMAFRNNGAWKDYINEIRMGGKANRSKLSLLSLQYYTGVLPDCPLTLDVQSLVIDGTVNDLTIKDLKAKEINSGLYADLKGSMVDITDISDARIDADIHRLDFGKKTVGTLLDAFGISLSPEPLRTAGKLEGRLRGRLWGKFSELNADADLTTNLGSISADLSAAGLTDSSQPLTYKGKVEASNLDLGDLLDYDMLGKATLAIDSKGTVKRGDITNSFIDIDRAEVSKIVFKDYEYTRIESSGTLDGGMFDGRIEMHDPNLDFLFIGGFSLKSKRYDFYSQFDLNIAVADLNRTGIYKKGSKTEFTGKVQVNMFVPKGTNTLLGSAFVDPKSKFVDDNGKHLIGDTVLNLKNERDRQIISLRSNFATFDYEGDKNILELPRLFQDAFEGKDISASRFGAELIVKDASNILSILPEKLKIEISEGSHVSTEMRKGHMEFDGEVNSLSINGLALKDITLGGKLDGNLLSADAKASMDKLDGTGLKAGIDVKIAADTTSHSLNVEGNLRDSELRLFGDRWTISNSPFVLDGKRFAITDLIASNVGRSVRADGSIAFNNSGEQGELNVAVNNLDLGIADSFLKDIKLPPLDGTLNGNLFYNTPSESNMGLWGNLVCESLKIGNYDAGAIKIDAAVDSENEDYIDLKLSNATVFAPKAISTNNLRINRTSGLIQGAVMLNDFSLAILQPFAEEYCSGIEGKLNGRVRVNGNVRSENFLQRGFDPSELILSDGAVKVNLTGSSYKMGGKLRITEDTHRNNRIVLDNLKIDDLNGGNAVIKGDLSEITLSLDRLNILNSNAGMVVGKLDLSGNADVKINDLKEMDLDVNAHLATAGEGKVAILADLIQPTEVESIITFVEEGKEIVVKDREKKAVKLKLNGDLSISPSVSITATLNQAASMLITARGSGNVAASYDPTVQKFKFGGNYNISDGRFQLDLLGLMKKEFKVQNGSSLKLSSENLMDSELDITAIYSTRASLNNLVAVSSLKNVDCLIGVGGRLQDPKLSYGIEVHDLDPTTQSMVDSELNTEDKVQKQLLALVSFNTFATSEMIAGTATDTQTGTNVVFNTLVAASAGQASSFLRKIGSPFDVGANFQQNEMGQNVYGANMSGDLFNDRVQVNAAVGNRQYSSSSTDEIVGDIDVSIKLGDQENLKMKMFSHSADGYTNYLDNSQRNGAGISYQKEFDSFWDYLKGVFSKKKSDETAVQPERKTITISE